MSNNNGNLERRSRMFSLNSHKSGRSQRSNHSGGPKIDLHESHEEKQKKTIKSKADPRLAITEEQPSSLAAAESTSIPPIRAIQHKDKDGNPIADPDRSNPTRSRWERPLDTIRSFEAAVDGDYKRKSFARSYSGDALNNMASRRSSYYQGGYGNPGRGHYEGGYGGRAGPSRPESYVDSYYNGQGPPPRARMNQRMTPPPGLNGYDAGGAYPSYGNQQSYDTVTTGSGSGSHGTDPWGNSTDPSSDNSSIERGHPLPKPDGGDFYGTNAYGGPPQYANQGYGEQDPGQGYVTRPSYGQSSPLSPSNGRYYEQGENGLPGPPPPPHKDTPPRVPIKLGGGSSSAGPPASNSASYQADGVGTQEKRKSWFKKFGKGN